MKEELKEILNSKTFRISLAIFLFIIMILNLSPSSISDFKYWLWSCDLMSLLLIINLLFLNNPNLYFFIFLVTWTTTIEWVIDYFKMLLGFSAPKTEWMLNTDSPLIFTEIQHGLIMIVPFIYFLINKKPSIKEQIRIFVLYIFYILILSIVSIVLTKAGFIEKIENINCFIYFCGTMKERNLIDIVKYIIHFYLNAILLLLVLNIKRIQKHFKNIKIF